jgi:phospholipid/cholesterol/gamma-HCH transport system substrate-binding protein
MDAVKYTKLGLFSTIAIVILISTVFFLGKNKSWLNPQIELNGIFKNVGGLAPGANVRLAGITIGEVKEIFVVSDSSAQVVINVAKEYQKRIKKDAAMSIGSDGLVGDKIINIIPGDPSNKSVVDKGFLSTYTPINTDAVLENLQHISLNASSITSDLALLMKSIRDGKGAIGTLFMDTAVSQNLKQTISNLNAGSKKLDQNLDAAKNSFLLKPLIKSKKQREKEREKNEIEKNIDKEKHRKSKSSLFGLF